LRLCDRCVENFFQQLAGWADLPSLHPGYGSQKLINAKSAKAQWTRRKANDQN
jgi:hypothetical protein